MMLVVDGILPEEAHKVRRIKKIKSHFCSQQITPFPFCHTQKKTLLKYWRGGGVLKPIHNSTVYPINYVKVLPY